MNRSKAYVTVGVKALFFCVFLACLAIASEMLFVFIANISGKSLRFNSMFALNIFSLFAGFLPLSKTPNRISEGQLSGKQRMLLFVEITFLVVVASKISASYMAFTQRVIEGGLAMAAAAYCFSLILGGTVLACSIVRK